MKTARWQPTTKLSKEEIQRFQRILQAQRTEALRTLNRLGDEARGTEAESPQDIGDLCTATLSRESLFQQTGERRLMVRDLEAALARIRHGTFGVCVACGDDINPRRLDAVPWTEYCLRCQEGFEEEIRAKHFWSTTRGVSTLRKVG
jgi:DnaK suppressor protein